MDKDYNSILRILVIVGKLLVAFLNVNALLQIKLKKNVMLYNFQNDVHYLQFINQKYILPVYIVLIYKGTVVHDL